MRLLGLRSAGGNNKTLKRHIAHYGISTDHFHPNWTLRGPVPRPRIPLEQILVEGSNYSRWALKRRLYAAGLKQRVCELCGQGEEWRGKSMTLILDHINGMATDNRLENLQIVCPNCAATLDTHCGRKNKLDLAPRRCERCCSRLAEVPRAPILLAGLRGPQQGSARSTPGEAKGGSPAL